MDIIINEKRRLPSLKGGSKGKLEKEDPYTGPLFCLFELYIFNFPIIGKLFLMDRTRGPL
jgi:hypothetical protein